MEDEVAGSWVNAVRRGMFPRRTAVGMDQDSDFDRPERAPLKDPVAKHARDLQRRLRERREITENKRERALAAALNERLRVAGVFEIEEVNPGLYQDFNSATKARVDMHVIFGLKRKRVDVTLEERLVSFGIGPDDESPPTLFHDDTPVTVDVAAMICLDVFEAYAKREGLL